MVKTAIVSTSMTITNSSYMSTSSAVSPSAWIKAAEPYFLTIKDIEFLEVGESINLFLLSGIIKSSCSEKINKRGKVQKPDIFFKNGFRVNFKKVGDGLKGQWIFNNNPNKIFYKEFQVKVDGKWIPLKNNFVETLKGTIYYGELDPSTRIGWKGEIMKIKDMNKCPNIIWNG
jgi:hypothetical protein